MTPIDNRNGDFARLSGCVPCDFRCTASLRRSFLSERRVKKSLRVIINAPRY